MPTQAKSIKKTRRKANDPAEAGRADAEQATATYVNDALDAIHDDVLIDTIRRALATEEPAFGLSRHVAHVRNRAECAAAVRLARIAAISAQAAVVKNVLRNAALMHELAERVRRQDQRRKSAKRQHHKGGRPEVPHRIVIRSLQPKVLNLRADVVLRRLESRGDIEADGNAIRVLDKFCNTLAVVERDDFISSIYEEKAKANQKHARGNLENSRK